MPQTIVAVAIGPNYRHVTINALPLPDWVRKYIKGFIDAFPPNLGAGAADYVIDYRECPTSDLGRYVFTPGLIADYIICMSTPVVRQAALKYPATNGTPIIGMVSDPSAEVFYTQRNVCGVSAGRSGDAASAYSHLLDTVRPRLASAVVLHDSNHSPSVDSVKVIHAAGHVPTIKDVHTPADVQQAIAASAGSGMLLLPVDWMFGVAPQIIGWATGHNVLDFWLVTDWVQPSPSASAFGGYGVPQETSGSYLAQQVDAIWNNDWPNPVWLPVPQYERAWKASQTRALGAAKNLNNNGPPNGPEVVP
jgi:hypothetical protein